jgi:hypothetical protein
MEQNRARPCGKCEKCHRIVAMLSALGGDPVRCGYTEAQIDACLRRLPNKGMHQESATAEHVLSLLRGKGLVGGGEGASPHPEVEGLRFDSEHSPIDEIPTELRKPLLELCLRYARGALRWRDGHWQELDPLFP